VTAALLRLNRRTFASLKHRNYRLFFFGQVISVTGTWMQNIAMAWLVLELTGSPVAVGVLALCQFLPFSLFGLFSGVFADRLDPRRLVIATQAASMVLATALAALTVLGDPRLWQIYVLAALRGTVLVFDAPARQAFTYQMVGPAELPNAVALNSSLFNGARVAGPAIGGVLVALFGPGLCFTINAVSFLAVLVCLLAMRVDELVPLERNGARPEILRGTWEAIRYARRDRRVGLVLVLVAVVSTFAFNFNVLLPVLARETLDSGPAVFGILSASFGAGALAGALLSATIGRASLKVLVAGTTGFGLAELLLAPVSMLPIASVLLAATGLCFTLWTSNANSSLQLGTPDGIRGRVLGLYFYAFLGAQPLGGLVAGWLAELGGTALALAFAGAVTLVTSAIVFMKLREQPRWRPAEAVGRGGFTSS
jgi:MFS family permease